MQLFFNPSHACLFEGIKIKETSVITRLEKCHRISALWIRLIESFISQLGDKCTTLNNSFQLPVNNIII